MRTQDSHESPQEMQPLVMVSMARPVNSRMAHGVRLMVAALALHTPLAGATHDYPSVHFRGFGTAAVGGTDTDRLGFRIANNQRKGLTSRWGFDTDSRLGLQLDAEINQTWHAGIQWVARNHAGDFFEQNLDWAYLRWRPKQNLDLRLGRLGLDIYFLSDYRNVGYAYPWIRPPHEFYGSNAIYHFDGADIAKRFKFGEGYLTTKLFAGHAFFQLPIYQSGVFDGGVSLGGGKLAFEQGPWQFRLAYMYTEQTRELPIKPLKQLLLDPGVNAGWPGASDLVPRLRAAGRRIQFSSLGLAYDNGVWLAQMEASYVDSSQEVVPDAATAYLSVGRRFDKFTFYTVYGIGQTLRHEVKLPALRNAGLGTLRREVDTVFNGNGQDEQSLSLGARWDVYRNVALKAQWSHYWLGHNGVVQWDEPGTGNIPNNVNVWTLGVDFLF